MKRIPWEKLPRPLKIVVLPFALLMATVGWTAIVMGEQQNTQRKAKKAPRQIERVALHSR